ncbi:hypothetical protein BMS3Abin04_02880 [bacterium BMS3Abin04]|nr:hypothetical protein BMS3Abin04_02880 [bacterium BMS3Abin04]
MLNKHAILMTIFGLLFLMATTLPAQDKPSEKKVDNSMMQKEDMHKCMDKIASDEHMRGKMMTKMMDHMKGDSTGMMKMCKTMMSNLEMHSMMKKMMGNNSKDHEGMMMNGGKMNHDKKSEGKTKHEDYHKK